MDFTHKGRLFNHRRSNTTYTQAFSAFLFFGSLGWYTKRYFLNNKSIAKFALFTAGSYFVANEWGKFFFLPIDQEALLINNNKELCKFINKQTNFSSKKESTPPLTISSYRSQGENHSKSLSEGWPRNKILFYFVLFKHA